VLVVGSLLVGNLAKWPVLMLGVGGAAFAARRFVPLRWDPWLRRLPYLLPHSAGRGVPIPVIVPQLAR